MKNKVIIITGMLILVAVLTMNIRLSKNDSIASTKFEKIDLIVQAQATEVEITCGHPSHCGDCWYANYYDGEHYKCSCTGHPTDHCDC